MDAILVRFRGYSGSRVLNLLGSKSVPKGPLWIEKDFAPSFRLSSLYKIQFVRFPDGFDPSRLDGNYG